MTQPAPDVNAAVTGPTALVLDVDGRLLDTVYLHVIAWREAFIDGGYEVPGVDVHRVIGRGMRVAYCTSGAPSPVARLLDR